VVAALLAILNDTAGGSGSSSLTAASSPVPAAADFSKQAGDGLEAHRSNVFVAAATIATIKTL